MGCRVDHQKMAFQKAFLSFAEAEAEVEVVVEVVVSGFAFVVVVVVAMGYQKRGTFLGYVESALHLLASYLASEEEFG